jgi:hypothetical protein
LFDSYLFVIDSHGNFSCFFFIHCIGSKEGEASDFVKAAIQASLPPRTEYKEDPLLTEQVNVKCID